MPTDLPEADGTFAWDSTTLVLVRVRAGDVEGVGWTYGDRSVAGLVRHTLAPVVEGLGAADPVRAWVRMQHQVRNTGRDGVAALGISAVDLALWDLKARLLGLPLHRLLGSAYDRVPVYGSGGFTTYDQGQLALQVQEWLDQGVRWVKIKIGEARGTRTERDVRRTRQVREQVGAKVGVFVDANGAYSAKQAIGVARCLEDLDVGWFEEPVTSDDLPGLRQVRDAVRPDVAAGEYVFDLDAARVLCSSGAVDCLQLDVTRCGGITGWIRAAAVADAHHLEVSGHCAPHLSLPACAATPNLRHLEWFHDHVRLERMLFDGCPDLVDGQAPLSDQPGHGLVLTPGAERFRVA